MKPLLLPIVCGVVTLSAIAPAGAQWLRPIDPRKQADVSGKMIEADDIELKLLSHPARETPRLSLSGRGLTLKQIHTKAVDLQTLELRTFSTETLPQAHFSAENAAVAGKKAQQAEKHLQQPRAPINSRQIRAFEPAGEEELKKQLNEPQ